VLFRDGKGRVRSLPTAWTSLASVDPFVVLSQGRSFFRLEDLGVLVTLVKAFTVPEGTCKADSADDVKRNISASFLTKRQARR
jgi:hypothetical protein